MRGAREKTVDGASAHLTSQAASRAGPSAGSAAAATPRLLYVDWLRVLAVIGVFVIHVCAVFDPFDGWHIQNAERSRVVGEVIVLMAPWIMPLFMLLAGVSACYSLSRRSNARYVRERVTRLLIPLVLGTLLFVPPQVYLERRLNGEFAGSLWSFYPHFFDGIYPRGNLSWHHLWFLGHLFGYSLIALPLFRHWQTDRGRAQLQSLAKRCSGAGGLLLLALPLVLERHLLWWLFRERHMLTSDWSNHAVLFVAYIYGFALAGEPALGAAIDKHWRGALATAVVTTALLVVTTWVGIIPAHLPEPYEPGYLAFWTLYAVGAWASMVSVLAAGRRWLYHETAVLAYGRRFGFAWYLVHQPIIVAVAFVVVHWKAGLPIKLMAVASASLLGTLIGAELLGRTEITRRAFGVPPA